MLHQPQSDHRRTLYYRPTLADPQKHGNPGQIGDLNACGIAAKGDQSVGEDGGIERRKSEPQKSEVGSLECCTVAQIFPFAAQS